MSATALLPVTANHDLWPAKRAYRHVPPFSDPKTLELAHRRGLLAPDEDFEMGIRRVAGTLAKVDAALCCTHDARFETALTRAMQEGRLGLSSQLFAAAGRSADVAACTVLRTPTGDDDSLRRLISDAAAASCAGLGCGFDLSRFEDPTGTLAVLRGPMHQLHTQLVARGQRPPAFMVTCDARHPRVRDFVNAKAGADFGSWAANISILFDDDDRLWEHLRDDIARAAHRNGEPGVLFRAPADADNPTPDYRIESAAPCAEVFLAPDERCVFVSINLAALVDQNGIDWELFAESVRLAVRAADDVVELAAIGAHSIVRARRRIGVGLCGFHSALIALGMPYAASIPLARTLAERLTYVAHSASVDLARQRGCFPAWTRSRWRDEAWVNRKVAARADAVDASAWARLTRDASRDGIRNASVVAFPPTGIVSELLGVSKSYEPLFQLWRTPGQDLRPEVANALRAEPNGEAMARAIIDPDSDGRLSGAAPCDLLACARQLPPEVHLDVHAAFCAMADEAGSKTVNLATDTTVATVATLFDRARGLGLKGLTVFRAGCLGPGHAVWPLGDRGRPRSAA